MEILKKSGGAKVGWVKASWPFGGIEVEPGRITVRCLGSFSFTPEEVTAIEEVGSIPLFSKGHRIHHTKADYPEGVAFFSLSGYQGLTKAIRQAGFRVGDSVSQAERGFPFKIPAVVAVVVVWNVLFLLDRPFLSRRSPPGPFPLLALALVLGLATFLPKSPLIQKTFLGEGRRVAEVAPFLRLLQIVSAFMLIGFGLLFLLGRPPR